MKRRFKPRQIVAIIAIAFVSLIITWALLMPESEPENDVQQTNGHDNPANEADALIPTTTGFTALNGNPWGLTGTQTDLIQNTLATWATQHNQTVPAAERIAEIDLNTNTIEQDIDADGSYHVTFTIDCDNSTVHTVIFTIPDDYGYRVSVDGEEVPLPD
jgi:hypothetical protein